MNIKRTPTILIVCNAASTAPVWGYMIRERKLLAIIETNPQNAIKRCEQDKPALTILDLQLPHSKTLDLCLRVRAVSINPILLFLPSYDENLIVDCYDTGIDDCLVKPVSPAVFYVKIRSWLRHSKQYPVTAMPDIQVGDFYLDPEHGVLIQKDECKTIKLTDLEFRLLHLLMSQPDHVFDADSIVNQVWGLYGEQDVTLIKHVVFRLRRKLEDDPDNPRWIQTWYGKGYSFRSQ